MSTIRSVVFVVTVALVAMAPVVSLAGGGLAVSPVTLEFDANGAPRALEVSNPGEDPTDVQVRLFAWSAENGEDRTTASADIAFSPPMFRLAKGGTQTVRFVVQAPANGRERAYRLYVDQLPSAPEPGHLQMPVRMVLPLFVEASSRPATRSLRWRAIFDPAHKRVRLVAANDGDRRVRLTNLAYERDGQAHPIAPGLSGYVLAGAERAWDFDYSGPLDRLTVKASSDQGDLTAQAPFASG